MMWPCRWRKNQAIYVQDFPRKQPQQGSQPSTDMEGQRYPANAPCSHVVCLLVCVSDQLVAFLSATTKAADWCDKIRQFDYSTAIGKIVASVPVSVSQTERPCLWSIGLCSVVCVTRTQGAHKGSDINRWGHMRLRHVLESEPDPQGLQE